MYTVVNVNELHTHVCRLLRLAWIALHYFISLPDYTAYTARVTGMRCLAERRGHFVCCVYTFYSSLYVASLACKLIV